MLKREIQQFLNEFEDGKTELKFLNNFAEIKDNPDGWYCLKSNMYNDRYELYHKKTKRTGSWYWSNKTFDINKIFIFSVLKENEHDEELNLNEKTDLLKKSLLSIEIIKESLCTNKLEIHQQDELFKELKSVLQKRRKSING